MAGPRPASPRSVAILRPGCTASRGAAEQVAEGARGALEVVHAERESPQPRGAVGIARDARALGREHHLEDRLARAEERLATWIRRAWGPRACGAGRSPATRALRRCGRGRARASPRGPPGPRRSGCGPAASPALSSPSVQPMIPRRAPFPVRRQGHARDAARASSTSNPAALQAAGSSAISSASMLGTRRTLPGERRRYLPFFSWPGRRGLRRPGAAFGSLHGGRDRLGRHARLRRDLAAAAPGATASPASRLRLLRPCLRPARRVRAARPRSCSRACPARAGVRLPSSGCRCACRATSRRVAVPVRARGAALRAALAVVALARDLLAVRAARADRLGPGRHERRRRSCARPVRRGRALHRAVALRRVLDRHLARHDAAAGEHADDRDLRERGRAEREPAAGGRAGRRAAGDARRAHHARLQSQARRDRERRGQHLALAAHLLAVGAAARAVAQVMAKLVRRSAPPRRFASCSRISAHGVSRADRRSISELRARKTMPLHARHLAAEHLGHLGVREPGRLGEQERGALLLGQLARRRRAARAARRAARPAR